MAKTDILKISFEFSPKLGIRQLPKLNAEHESNVSGLYIVGDLADAPIIKVALNQGYEVACRVIRDLQAAGEASTSGGDGDAREDVLDVAVIGAGPAGIGAALALEEAGARYVVFEREKPFNTIQNFPKAKRIFSEPRDVESQGNFWFEDAQKEELVERWEEALEEKMLTIQQPEEVTHIFREGGLFTVETTVDADGLMQDEAFGDASAAPGATNRYRARRVVLAVGRRGAIRKLEIPGEALPKVNYTLRDPADYAGKRLLVVGGGDSAVEAAVSCAEAGAEVAISYRGNAFHRAKAQNREQIEALIRDGAIRVEYGTVPVEIREDAVTLERHGDAFAVENDQVLVFIGTELPLGFLRKIGVKMAGAWDVGRAVWVVSFALVVYLVYVIKKGKGFWPFGEGQPLEAVPQALQSSLGFRAIDGAFWGTLLYTLLIVVFGIRAYRKYPLKTQKVRYLWLIGFQVVMLFGIPEIIAPLFIHANPETAYSIGLGGVSPEGIEYAGRGWKLYTLGVPWPLWTGTVVEGPQVWAAGGHATAIAWILVGVVVSFVAIPLFVRYHGERFCSYACGCGGLAETLGDYWRHLAPRGKTAQQAEIFGRIVLLAAIPVTFFMLNDLWAFFEGDTWSKSSSFAQKWYDLVVDFWLASVIGVAFYPYLGNRVWCRFFCPLRAFMEKLASWFSKISIKSNEKCIGCGECTRYCQMGIDVQAFAQKQEEFHNGNSACIQCGICIQVCPMEVLYVGERGVNVQA